MDYFALLLDGLCLTGQGVMHILFASRLTGKQQKPWHIAVYCLALFTIQFVSVRLDLNEMLSNGAGILTLYAVSRLALGNQRPISCLAAVLAFYISQLSFGILNSLEAVIFPGLIGNSLLYLLLLAAQLLFSLYAAAATAQYAGSWTGEQTAGRPILACCCFPSCFSLPRRCTFSGVHTACTSRPSLLKS